MLGKFGITASSICSCAFIVSDSISLFLGIAKFDNKLREIRMIANVHVAFSKKSVVFFAPIIWLPAPPPKEEESEESEEVVEIIEEQQPSEQVEEAVEESEE